MLKVGAQAPSFFGRTTHGELVSLNTWAGRPLIIYFFHRAFTPNCTVETKGFRDNYEELKALGYEVVGISTDTEETQCRFAEHHGVTYAMIGDRDGVITRTYDVKWPLIPFARRVAYVLNAQHQVLAVFNHEFQANRHLDEILQFARKHPVIR